MRSTPALLALFLALAGCSKSAASSGEDAGCPCACASAAAAASESSSAAPVASASSSAAARAEPPEEDDVDCDKDVCKVGLISEAAKAELEQQSGYKSKKLQFRENTTDEQLKTLSMIPWVTRVGLDGCKEITDLKPLADLKGLKELSAEDAQKLADLAPLAGLVELEKLSIAKTAVENLGPVKNLLKLTRLDLQSTKITDVGPIGGLSKLEFLGASSVKAKDWSPLQRLTSLKHLEIAHADLKSTYLLSGMKGMKTLNLAQNKELKDITGLKQMVDLEVLKIDDCPIVSVAPMAGMVALHRFSAAGTKVMNIQALSNLSELKSVDMRNTPCSDFDPLASSAKTLHFLGLPKGTTSDQYSAITESNRKVHPTIDGKKH